jgi:hypothetical protein
MNDPWAAAQLELDDLHAFLRALERALHNPRIGRDELAGAISVALDGEASPSVGAEMLRHRDRSLGQTRPPTRSTP